MGIFNCEAADCPQHECALEILTLPPWGLAQLQQINFAHSLGTTRCLNPGYAACYKGEGILSQWPLRHDLMFVCDQRKSKNPWCLLYNCRTLYTA